MPQGDGTGPRGLGPQTGRGAWLCANPETAVGQYSGVNRGLGMGRGGRGLGLCRRMPGRTWTGQAAGLESAQVQSLRDRIRQLEEQLEELGRRAE